jgi:triosephosphate isomerase
MSKIIIANFKANGCKEFFNNWLLNFKNQSENQILLAPPPMYLDFFSEKKHNFELCSQNVCEFDEGPFTSQYTSSMLLDFGVKSCIIGHSESRTLLKEDDDQIFKKFQKLNNKKIRSVVCIGEPLEIRESNKV